MSKITDFAKHAAKVAIHSTVAAGTGALVQVAGKKGFLGRVVKGGCPIHVAAFCGGITLTHEVAFFALDSAYKPFKKWSGAHPRLRLGVEIAVYAGTVAAACALAPHVGLSKLAFKDGAILGAAAGVALAVMKFVENTFLSSSPKDRFEKAKKSFEKANSAYSVAADKAAEAQKLVDDAYQKTKELHSEFRTARKDLTEKYNELLDEEHVVTFASDEEMNDMKVDFRELKAEFDARKLKVANLEKVVHQAMKELDSAKKLAQKHKRYADKLHEGVKKGGKFFEGLKKAEAELAAYKQD